MQLDVLKNLFTGQSDIEETIKLLKLPSNEEVIKVLSMIKTQKLSVEDGHELLSIINSKQADSFANPGKNGVRLFGIASLALGVLLYFFSIFMIPVTWYYGSNTPNTSGTVLKPLEILNIALLFLVSHLVILSGIGIATITNWGRKIGVVCAWIIMIASLSLLALNIYGANEIYAQRSIRSVFANTFLIFAMTFLVTLFHSMWTLATTGRKKTKELIQMEQELRDARNSRVVYKKNRVFRSRTNKVLLGVCGGFAEYLNIDPSFVRIGVVLVSLVTNSITVPIYLVCWLIIPLEPENPRQ